MCSWNWEKFKIVDKKVLNLLYKNMNSPTVFSEASENVFLFVFISWLTENIC